MNDIEIALLTKYIPKENNAGQKAPRDVERIFDKYYGKTYRTYETKVKFIRNLDSIIHFWGLKRAGNISDIILFVQWPLYTIKPYTEEAIFAIGFKYYVAIIHDIDSIRFFPGNKSKLQDDVRKLNRYDVVICHNIKMESLLRENGLTTKVININIFDYLDEDNVQIIHKKPYNILFAGNLNKSSFLVEACKAIDCKILAYGQLDSYLPPDKIQYMGMYSPDKLRKKIIGDFGLIWDGESIHTCSGKNGDYMRYNNPHKLSLYLSCGIPIITWKEAAIAELIEKNELGFSVNNLKEASDKICEIDTDTYRKYLRNAENVKIRILKGENTINAVNKAIEELL